MSQFPKTTVPADLSNHAQSVASGEQCRWRSKKLLAVSQISYVYLVRDHKRRLRVLKKVNCSLKQREAEIMRDYGHCRRLPRLYASWEEKGYMYLLMEYIRGPRLDQYVQYVKKLPQPLDESKIRWILGEILRILQYLHTRPRPIYHLDIKEEQFIVRRGQLCLVDFGLAIHRDGPRWQPSAGRRGGTLGYISPEHILTGQNCMDERADIFSAGVIGHCLVTGRPPPYNWAYLAPAPLIEADTPYTPRLVQAINRAIAIDRDKRWRSALDFLTAL